MDSPSAKALALLPNSFRFQYAIALGVHRRALAHLQASGEIEKLGRGVYRKAVAVGDGRDDLVVVFQRAPEAVLCLDSALYFHGLGTRIPHQVTIAVERKAWLPVIKQPPVQAFRFSGEAFTEGIEQHDVQGVTVRVYSKAKTVADCFKYRNKLGLETALEALRSLVGMPGFTTSDLLHCCRICRVEKVVQPYLEALL